MIMRLQSSDHTEFFLWLPCELSCVQGGGGAACFHIMRFAQLPSAGHVGTTQQQCEDGGCCWQPAEVSKEEREFSNRKGSSVELSFRLTQSDQNFPK